MISIVVFVTLIVTVVQAQTYTYTVKRVTDGDTLYAIQTSDNKEVRIRLICCDAPEFKQTPWGEYSLAKLKTLLPENSKFTITKPSLDQYKRILGEVINANGINVNAEMTKVGMAARYPFQSGCTAYKNYESVAKQAQLGLWSVENFCMPWNYRQNKCS